jgi:hypothetical protein
MKALGDRKNGKAAGHLVLLMFMEGIMPIPFITKKILQVTQTISGNTVYTNFISLVFLCQQ